MYVKMPIKGLVNDTILNKPIIKDDEIVGIITHYDAKYIYGTLWMKTGIEIEQNGSFSAVVMVRKNYKEEVNGYNISSR